MGFLATEFFGRPSLFFSTHGVHPNCADVSLLTKSFVNIHFLVKIITKIPYSRYNNFHDLNYKNVICLFTIPTALSSILFRSYNNIQSFSLL